MLRRAGLFAAIDQAFRRNFYDSEEDAVTRARERHDALGSVQNRFAGDGAQDSGLPATPTYSNSRGESPL